MNFEQYEKALLIEISNDKLTAFLTIKHLTDSMHFDQEQLIEFLRSKNVLYGLLYDNLNGICRDPISYLNRKIEIAKGDAPTKGADGYVEYVTKSSETTSKLDDTTSNKEKVDFKQVTTLDNVIKGQLVATLIPPKAGKSGIGVNNESLAPLLGKPARFKKGKNVVSNQDGTALYSAIDGLISLTENDKVNVFPVYEVKGDVDYSVGNIDFVGTVVIRGNVLTGFKVRAAGDIRIVGGVEGADIESDGNIEITGGIIAGNKGSIKAKHSLRCSFIQDATVSVGEDVIVSQSIMHSVVRAGRSIICDQSKGLIVGGVIQAGVGVVAKTIGNGMSTFTSVEVGVLPQLREEQGHLRATLKEQIDNLDRSEKALVILDQMAATGKLTADRLVMRQKLMVTKQQTSQIITQTKERILEIEKILENSDNSYIIVQQTVYSGVKLVIGRYTKFIKDSTRCVKFKYEDGDIVMHPLF